MYKYQNMMLLLLLLVLLLLLLLCGMSDKWQQVSALSHSNYAIIRSNTVTKENHTKHIMLCTETKQILWWDPACDKQWSSSDGSPFLSLPDHRPTTHWVIHNTSCIIQSNAPDDAQNYCPKHVELIWIY